MLRSHFGLGPLRSVLSESRLSPAASAVLWQRSGPRDLTLQMRVAPMEPSALAERIQPLFLLIAEYLAGSPQDFIGLLYLPSRSVASQFRGGHDNHLWRSAYSQRRPRVCVRVCV